MNSNNVNNVLCCAWLCMVLRGCPFHIASFIANECCSSDQIKRAHQESECQAMPLSRFANLCYYFIIKYTTNASTILLWRLHSRCFLYVANESREKMSTAVFFFAAEKVSTCASPMLDWVKNDFIMITMNIDSCPFYFIYTFIVRSSDEYSNELRIIIIFFR